MGEREGERGGVSLTSLSLLSTADAEVVCMHREIGALPTELKFRIQKLTLVSNLRKMSNGTFDWPCMFWKMALILKQPHITCVWETGLAHIILPIPDALDLLP